MAIVVAIAHKKGGVGKTTSTVNLAASLVMQFGKRVLLVDDDSQANASMSCGVAVSAKTIYDVYCKRATVREATVKTQHGFDLLPSELNLSAFDSEVSKNGGHLQILKKALEPVQDLYDYILIDTPPELSVLTNNALVAADEVIIPVQASVFSVNGLIDLMKAIGLIQKTVNKDLKVRGVFMTLMENKNVCKRCHDATEKIVMMNGYRLCNTIVRRNVRIEEAPDSGSPAVLLDKKTPAVQAYHELAAELFPEAAGMA